MKIITKSNRAHDHRYQHVKTTQCKLEAHHFAEVLTQQVMVLRDVAVVEIGKAEVEENIQKQRIVEDHSVLTITDVTDLSLHLRLHKNCPERLYQKIQHHEDGQIEYELFLLHPKACKDS